MCRCFTTSNDVSLSALLPHEYLADGPGWALEARQLEPWTLVKSFLSPIRVCLREPARSGPAPASSTLVEPARIAVQDRPPARSSSAFGYFGETQSA